METAYLYRHYDEKDNLLYVGISLSAINRLYQHKQGSHWFEEIAKVTIEKFTTREDALEGEKKAILKENPKHNIMRPVVVPIIDDQSIQSTISKNDLLKRIVQFNPIYTLHDAATCLGTSVATIKKWIEEKKLGYISYGSYPGKNGVCHFRRITGWQLIDFIEYMEKIKEDMQS